jgi:hemolysin activation/secretion protein
VDIPEQDVSDGIVMLQVIEGQIDRLRISGSRYFSLHEIRESVPALNEGQVPYLPDVQKQLQALNSENADRQVTPIFRAGRSPGTVEVELRVKDEVPFHASLELNGRNSVDTTRTRLVADIRYDNLWQKSHSMSLMYQTSPQDTNEVEVLATTYVMPVGDSGDRLAFYAVDSQSNSEVASAGALAVIGKGTIFGARWVNPLESTADYYHVLTLGADYKDFDEGTQLVGADTLETPISYTKFSLEYGASIPRESVLTSFSAEVNLAPRGLGNSETEFEEKRYKAQPDFIYLTADLKHERRFDNGMRLRGVLNGQLANEPLISNEQFSAGGAESVRGYHESEVLGDDGIQASIEIATPSYLAFEDKVPVGLSALAFIDGAYVNLHDSLPGVDSSSEIIGAGFGFRVTTPEETFKAAIDIAWALQETDYVDTGEIRVHFLLRAGF